MKMFNKCVYKLLEFIGFYGTTPIVEVKRLDKTQDELLKTQSKLARKRDIEKGAAQLSFSSRGIELPQELKKQRLDKMLDAFDDYLLDIATISIEFDFVDTFDKDVFIEKVRRLDTYRYIFYIRTSTIQPKSKVKVTEHKLIVDTQYLFDNLDLTADALELHTIASEVREAVRLYCEINLGRLL